MYLQGVIQGLFDLAATLGVIKLNPGRCIYQDAGH